MLLSNKLNLNSDSTLSDLVIQKNILKKTKGKRNLRKQWQHYRSPVIKTRLDKAIKDLKKWLKNAGIQIHLHPLKYLITYGRLKNWNNRNNFFFYYERKIIRQNLTRKKQTYSQNISSEALFIIPERWPLKKKWPFLIVENEHRVKQLK